MNNNPLRRLRKKLGLKQTELAEKLEVKQQAISGAERSASVPRKYREKLLEMFPEKRDIILETLEGGVAKLSSEDINEAARQPREPVPEFPPVEEKALPWAITFRNQALLDRLAHLARCAGLQSHPLSSQLPYGIQLTEGKEQSSKTSLGDALFPRSGKFGLKAGTVVLLGSPHHHPVTNLLLEVILKEVNVKFEFHVSKSNPFYFGYPTTFVDLRIEGKWFRPNRYVDEEDAVYFEDFGVILHAAPLASFIEKVESPFDKEAVRVVLVAGAHRLATGIGARLLEELELQKQMLKDEINLEGLGMLAYRVVVRNDGDYSTVEELSLIKRWEKKTANPR